MSNFLPLEPSPPDTKILLTNLLEAWDGTKGSAEVRTLIDRYGFSYLDLRLGPNFVELITKFAEEEDRIDYHHEVDGLDGYNDNTPELETSIFISYISTRLELMDDYIAALVMGAYLDRFDKKTV